MSRPAWSGAAAARAWLAHKAPLGRYDEAPADFLRALYGPAVAPCLLCFSLQSLWRVRGGRAAAQVFDLGCSAALEEEAEDWRRWVCFGKFIFNVAMLFVVVLVQMSPSVFEALVATIFTIDMCVSIWDQETLWEFALVAELAPIMCGLFAVLGIRLRALAPCAVVVFSNIIAVSIQRGVVSSGSTYVGWLSLSIVAILMVARWQHARMRRLYDAEASLAAEEETSQDLLAMLCDTVCWVGPDGDEVHWGDGQFREVMGCEALGARLSSLMASEEIDKVESARSRSRPPAKVLTVPTAFFHGPQGRCIDADLLIVDRRRARPSRAELGAKGFLLGIRVSSAACKSLAPAGDGVDPAPVPLGKGVAEEGLDVTHSDSESSDVADEYGDLAFAPSRMSVTKQVSLLSCSSSDIEHGINIDALPSSVDTLPSAHFPEPEMHECSREEIQRAILDGACHLPFPRVECRQTRGTLLGTLALMYEHALGGALVCIADPEAYQAVFCQCRVGQRGNPGVKSCDDGYMTRRMRGLHVSAPEFAAAFSDFTRHEDGDRWPADHPDRDARGRPKDGAILLSKHGYSVKSAVKLLGLCPAATWRNVGTKHEAALSCAWAVNGAYVFVRSDSGPLHLVHRQGRDLHVYALQ